MPFRALRALASPLPDLRDALPPAQALALGTALDLEPPTPHDRFAVPAALLGLLQAAAQRGPVLVVADDAQWLDGASRDALRFVARRKTEAPIGIIAAGRAAATPADGFDVRGLDVLDVPPPHRGPPARCCNGPRPTCPPGVAEELLDAADGNPLALLETPRLLSAEGSRPDAAHRAAAPGRGARGGVRARGRDAAGRHAPRPTVAAAMESGPVRLLLDALGRVGLDEATLARPSGPARSRSTTAGHRGPRGRAFRARAVEGYPARAAGGAARRPGADGPEAGTALFLSPKTIEHHLSAIYRKLGLRSPARSSRRWPSEEREPAAA